ncbi:MAG TPA: hypothetical protein VKY37_12335 [Brumimicrobium sp.]|nr:hypothetical protein [Brumimicrobium sp.]
MKNFTFIIIGLFLFTIASCKKEDIKPNNTEQEYTDDIQRTNVNPRNKPIINNSIRTATSEKETKNPDTTITITDPNRDEDDQRKSGNRTSK